MWQKKDIVNEFQRLGKRITKQRMVILDVILEQNWTDCKEVYYEAVQRDSTVGLSTVYRTIRMLEEMGVLKRVYQYVFTDESGEQVDGESEIIAPGGVVLPCWKRRKTFRFFPLCIKKKARK